MADEVLDKLRTLQFKLQGLQSNYKSLLDNCKSTSDYMKEYSKKEDEYTKSLKAIEGDAAKKIKPLRYKIGRLKRKRK